MCKILSILKWNISNVFCFFVFCISSWIISITQKWQAKPKHVRQCSYSYIYVLHLVAIDYKSRNKRKNSYWKTCYLSDLQTRNWWMEIYIATHSYIWNVMDSSNMRDDTFIVCVFNIIVWLAQKIPVLMFIVLQ